MGVERYVQPGLGFIPPTHRSERVAAADTMSQLKTPFGLVCLARWHNLHNPLSDLPVTRRQKWGLIR